MTRKVLALCVIAICTLSTTLAQSDEIFTIYLVRHSEKDHSSENHGNLPLSKCGKLRSEALSVFLSDVNIDAVYSTDYTRTRKTAEPTSTAKSITTQIYSATNLEQFAQTLLELKQDALVVGHSNTTGFLTGLLIGEEGEDIDLGTYDRIYQVVVSGNSAELHLFHSTFECEE